MENSTNSSEDQGKKSPDDVMNLVQKLYKKREAMPMQAEPEEENS